MGMKRKRNFVENSNAEIICPHDESCCSVCLCGYNSLSEKCTTPCGHSFHKLCIDSWLERKENCPICRKFVDAPEEIKLKKRRREVDQRLLNKIMDNQSVSSFITRFLPKKDPKV